MLRSSHPRQLSNQGAYSRLQQQEDDDEQEYDELLEAIAHQPNSILITSQERCTVVPPQIQPLPDLISDPPNRESFSSNLPLVTRRFLKNRLAFGQSSAASASSLASLPPVIMADIQNGHMPAHADPLLKELNTRGWTIVRRRRKKQRRTTSNGTGRQEPRQALTVSVFVNCDLPPPPGPVVAMLPPIASAAEDVRNFDDPIPVSRDTYAAIVQSVQSAIEQDIQPTRISQGSSGSYFCRDTKTKTVGVFKPKNEEPYGRLNPKWTKWIHRHLFPCCFGRSCLIPNLGYLSESASSLIDRRLGTMIVPHTHVAHIASPAFHYDYLDRRAAHLPPKIGSFQCFLDGFRDANLFLREHPFPLESSSSSIRFGRGAVWGGCLGQSSDDDDHNDSHDNIPDDEDRKSYSSQRNSTATFPPRSPKPAFRWTPQLQIQFRREFEQMVILDYLIRNTDRGLDNWMIKYCEGEDAARQPWLAGNPNRLSTSSNSSMQSVKSAVTATASDSNLTKRRTATPHIHIAAIDNGLAFPFKHPDEWRSYPYGWLGLPEPLVARPFSDAVRRQFLPLLSDPLWWRETVEDLRELFGKDADFNNHMFERQMAVLKGQGFNIMRVLKDPKSGPLDLVATERVLVRQEEIVIEYDDKILDQRNPSHTKTVQSDEPQPASKTRVTEGQRLRSKRSSSFNGTMTPIPDSVSISMKDTSFEEPSTSPRSIRRAWKDRVRDHMSLDLGRRKKKRSTHGFRHVGSDGELESGSDSEEDEQGSRHQVTIIMETIQVVKSRKPYFSCC